MPATPLRLIQDGRIQQGLHQMPVDEINYRDFHLRTAMGRKANALQRWFGFNQFQFISTICPSLIVGTAIVDTRLTIVAFVSIYHPKTGKQYRYAFKAPSFGGFSQINQTPDKGCWFFRQGRNTIELACHNNERTVNILLKDGTTVNMRFSQQHAEPIRLATRVDLNGFAYTQKLAGAPCQGRVNCPSGDFDLEAINASATLDWSAGYLRRRSFWNWACLAGVLADGRRVGLNGACFTNESSFTENGFWLDGKLHKLAGMVFDYDSDNIQQPWSIHSSDGRVQLTFTPEGSYVERNNFLIMASNFHQLFGHFSGTLTSDSGEIITIDNIHGFTEEHYAKW